MISTDGSTRATHVPDTKFERRSVEILGVSICTENLDELRVLIRNYLENSEAQALTFACANPHSLVVAQRDEVFRKALNGHNLVVADGVGLTVMARLLRLPIGPRITGPDFFTAVMEQLDRLGGRVFFLGSTPTVLAAIKEKLSLQYPNISVWASYSPPFGDWGGEEDEAIIAAIHSAGPDVLWVGLTAPKQEKWVKAHQDRLNVRLVGSVGAVFDFVAGSQPRAPMWMRRAGLEWLHRFISEPGRMWRRVVVNGPYFLFLMVKNHSSLQIKTNT